jgi:hypothetical protein
LTHLFGAARLPRHRQFVAAGDRAENGNGGRSMQELHFTLRCRGCGEFFSRSIEPPRSAP